MTTYDELLNQTRRILSTTAWYDLPSEAHLPDKICKDCKHYRFDGSQPAGSQHRCNRPIVNLITGQITPNDSTCEFQRLPAAAALCSIEGRFWEPRT